MVKKMACNLYGESSSDGGAKDCTGCVMGAKVCPGMDNAPSAERRAMTAATVNAFVDGRHADRHPLNPTPNRGVGAAGADGGGAEVEEEESVIAVISRLDALGYFSKRKHQLN